MERGVLLWVSQKGVLKRKKAIKKDLKVLFYYGNISIVYGLWICKNLPLIGFNAIK